MEQTEFIFPVGYHEFHKDQLFNFQLNRWDSWGYARFEDMVKVGPKINNVEDWKNEMIKMAEKAIEEDRLMNAAFYYRAAEFYTFADNSTHLQMFLIKKHSITSLAIFFTAYSKVKDWKNLKYHTKTDICP